jgi:hypothetical protein
MTKRERELGPLIRVKPQAHHPEDGSPILSEGEVYVTRTGVFYHSQRCERVVERPRTVLVTKLADVGQRKHCPNCNVGPELLAQFRFERAEWQRLNGELDRLGRAIAEYLLAKGPEAVTAEFLRINVIRYRETKQDLKNLSLRVAGVFPESLNAPNW